MKKKSTWDKKVIRDENESPEFSVSVGPHFYLFLCSPQLFRYQHFIDFNVPLMKCCPCQCQMTWTDDVACHIFQSKEVPRWVRDKWRVHFQQNVSMWLLDYMGDFGGPNSIFYYRVKNLWLYLDDFHKRLINKHAVNPFFQ